MTIMGIWSWVGFNIFVIAMLVLDLAVFHKKAHEVTIKEALIWSAVWIGLALLFNLGIYHFRGSEFALQFLAGYLIEKSLSVDNIFVFLLIFTYFKIKADYQHEILFWGILGALVMRALFIAMGITMIENFHWIIYVFGAFLIFTGIKMSIERDKEVHPENNPVIKLLKKFLPVTDGLRGHHFFVRENGKLFATPLFVVLLVVETTDVIFSVDSIPAILAISKDPFIVYTSNVFAILGLRALYFALSGIMHMFHYLHYGLSAILIFVGAKMCLTDIYKIPVVAALLVIVIILAVSITVSILYPKKEPIPESIKPI